MCIGVYALVLSMPIDLISDRMIGKTLPGCS